MENKTVEIYGIADDDVSALIGKKVMIRSNLAGVFAARLLAADLPHGQVTLGRSRRIWYWSGAASLSELALWGPANPDECKFPETIPGPHVVTDVIEIIPMTDVAWKTIKKTPVWQCRNAI